MLESLLARPRFVIGSCVLVCAGVLTVHPSWARSIGADVWNAHGLNKQVRTAASEEDRLTSEDDEVLHRIAIKESIISDLIAGRTTLADATERFTVLNEARPDYLTTVRDAFPGSTDQEKFARNVISFAVARVGPHERAALSSRLEAELQQTIVLGATH